MVAGLYSEEKYLSTLLSKPELKTNALPVIKQGIGYRYIQITLPITYVVSDWSGSAIASGLPPGRAVTVEQPPTC